MRLDKFLKVSRLVKRRTLAKEICDRGRVEVNGRPAKSGHAVKVGDELTLHFGQKNLVVRVTEVADNVSKENADKLYEVIREEHSAQDVGRD
jgi:ribosomal 50S subunit-recycling heat shock protein